MWIVALLEILISYRFLVGLLLSNEGRNIWVYDDSFWIIYNQNETLHKIILRYRVLSCLKNLTNEVCINLGFAVQIILFFESDQELKKILSWNLWVPRKTLSETLFGCIYICGIIRVEIAYLKKNLVH